MMKNMKKVLSVALVMVLMLTLVTVVLKKPSKAAGGYWLTGTNGSASCVYNSGKFKVTGSWGKGKSLSASASKFFNGKSKNMNKTFKKGSGFKTGSYGEGLIYDNSPELSEGEQVGITLHLKIKGGKVVAMVGSAM